MGYRLNRLDEPVFMAGPKPMRIEYGIHQRLESCAISIGGETVLQSVCMLSPKSVQLAIQVLLLPN